MIWSVHKERHYLLHNFDIIISSVNKYRGFLKKKFQSITASDPSPAIFILPLGYSE